MSASFDLEARQNAAKLAALRYIDDMSSGYTRRRRGKGFSYTDAKGALLQGEVRQRLESLAIPPAWSDVWISPWPDSHILATGRDTSGRKQYIYHPRWHQARTLEVFEQIPDFARALPTFRAQIDRNLRTRTFDTPHVSALAAMVLDQTSMRVGNETYAQERGTRGLTTLRLQDVNLGKSVVTFDYDAKSGKHRFITLKNRRVASQLRRLTRTTKPSDYLFPIHTEQDSYLTSDTLNEYIQEHIGPDFSAKDFRSWRGTREALNYLHGQPEPEDDKACQSLLREAYKVASSKLGNTPAVAREHYIHPGVILAAEKGAIWSVKALEEGSDDARALHLLESIL